MHTRACTYIQTYTCMYILHNCCISCACACSVAYLNHAIEEKEWNNDNSKRGCGHNDDNKSTNNCQKSEDEGTQRTRNNLVNYVSIL